MSGDCGGNEVSSLNAPNIYHIYFELSNCTIVVLSVTRRCVAESRIFFLVMVCSHMNIQ